MNKLGYIIAFVGGAAIGSLVTFKATKKMYDKIIREEIKSVKEVFSKRSQIVKEETVKTEKDEIVEKASHKPDISEYAKVLNNEDYTHYSKTKKDTDEKESPYVIEPEEFGEFDDYATISLTYYSDGILADDADEMIDDVEEVIGSESLDILSDEDTVYVRNDKRKCDYEVLFSEKLYSEITEEKPWLNHDMEE